MAFWLEKSVTLLNGIPTQFIPQGKANVIIVRNHDAANTVFLGLKNTVSNVMFESYAPPLTSGLLSRPFALPEYWLIASGGNCIITIYETAVDDASLFMLEQVARTVSTDVNVVGMISLPAGANVIGNVGLEAGANLIGSVGLAAGANVIGNVGLETGSNLIGAVNLQSPYPVGAVPWTVTGTSAANTDITITKAAEAAKRHYLCGYMIVLTEAAAAAAEALVEVRDDATALIVNAFGASSPRGTVVRGDFVSPVRLSVNTAANLYTAACGAATVTRPSFWGYTI